MILLDNCCCKYEPCRVIKIPTSVIYLTQNWDGWGQSYVISDSSVCSLFFHSEKVKCDIAVGEICHRKTWTWPPSVPTWSHWQTARYGVLGLLLCVLKRRVMSETGSWSVAEAGDEHTPLHTHTTQTFPLFFCQAIAPLPSKHRFSHSNRCLPFTWTHTHTHTGTYIHLAAQLVWMRWRVAISVVGRAYIPGCCW